MTNQTRVWTEEEIVELLEKSDKAVVRAVIAIYQRQTADEQTIKDTKYRNNVGFSAADAKTLSYYAQYALKTGKLTGKFLDKARTRIIKYRKQLLEIANNPIAA